MAIDDGNKLICADLWERRVKISSLTVEADPSRTPIITVYGYPPGRWDGLGTCQLPSISVTIWLCFGVMYAPDQFGLVS